MCCNVVPLCVTSLLLVTPESPSTPELVHLLVTGSDNVAMLIAPKASDHSSPISILISFMDCHQPTNHSLSCAGMEDSYGDRHLFVSVTIG